MNTFSRGLDEEFVKALNREYKRKGSWWKGFVDDKNLFLAIREDYVNFYYRGRSLLKLEWKNGTIIGRIHHKYLLRPDVPHEREYNGRKYINVKNGRVDCPVTVKDFFIEDLADLDGLKRAAKPHAGPENIGVYDIVLSHNKILDVEIAFKRERKRIDFSILRETGNGVNIAFFEAKHFDSKELRAEGDEKPKVIGQIECYMDLLKKNRDAIIGSYRRVCCNFFKLNGIDKRNPERHEMLGGIVDGSIQLDIDENPELVVLGFDGDQRGEEKWPHREKLKSRLKNKVHFVGFSEPRMKSCLSARI